MMEEGTRVNGTRGIQETSAVFMSLTRDLYLHDIILRHAALAIARSRDRHLALSSVDQEELQLGLLKCPEAIFCFSISNCEVSET